MQKTVILISVATAFLLAEDIKMDVIKVEAKTDKALSKQAVKESKSADLAEMLSNQSAEISFKRTTGMGQDLFIRGLGYENIAVEIDENKIYGGCPNHMDPPLSHIGTNEIERVEVKSGGYDLSSFGNMGGKVNVITKSPKEGFGGNVNLKLGSFGYTNASGSVSGGDKKVSASAGYETLYQSPYYDGDGKNIVENTTYAQLYKSDTKKERLYDMQNYWAKLKAQLGDTTMLKLNSALNRTSQAIYPGKNMDAVGDDALRLAATMDFANLASFSDILSVDVYSNRVLHDMDNFTFRNATMKMLTKTQSTIHGLKINNIKESGNMTYTYGADGYKRGWDVNMWSGATLATTSTPLDAYTQQVGAFAEIKRETTGYDLFGGLRVDTISTLGSNNLSSIRTMYGNIDDKNDQTLPSGYVKGVYKIDGNSNTFLGLSRSIRSADPTELYLSNSTTRGNPNLKHTKNNQVDLGYEYNRSSLSGGVNLFYSKLEDYIYAYKRVVSGSSYKTYENIDARIYGASARVGFDILDSLRLDNSVAIQKGLKDDKPGSVSDNDLPEIPPVKAISKLSFSQKNWGSSLEGIFAGSQKDIDSDSGEKEIAGYGVANLRSYYEPKKGFRVNAGVENLLDHNYAVSNSYDKDPINATTRIVNEPGRFIYLGASYQF